MHKRIFALGRIWRLLRGMRVLVVGCGYVGLPLAIQLKEAGHEVFGLRRSRAAEAELRSAGIMPLIGDITDASSLRRLPGAFDWVVNCTAAGGGGVVPGK